MAHSFTNHYSRAPPSMYRVPRKLYELNKEAYTPQAVTIGPLHNGNELSQLMQHHKEYYFNCFIHRTEADINLYYKMVEEWEGEARACYQGHINLNSADFVKMLLHDGIFIIEFFLRMRSNNGVDLGCDDDDIFRKEPLRNEIFHDLIMLENQLPFFVLERLYNLSITNIGVSWEEFVCGIAERYFEKEDINNVIITLEETHQNIRHLLDFLYSLCVVAIKKEPYWSTNGENFELSRSATELREAGAKFTRGETLHTLDPAFRKDNGLFRLPSIKVNQWTNIFFGNFIAHEHCLGEDKIICSYIILVGSLLKTAKDVDLLIEHKIFDNQWLGSREDVCSLFKNLYSRHMMDRSEFCYASLCEDLNKYYKDKWHQLKAPSYRWNEILKRDYFSNPWSVISIIAAALLLILTFIQTVCSIIAV